MTDGKARKRAHVTPDTDFVILSVSLASGDFESQLKVPTDSGPDVVKEKIDSWFQMIRFALANHVTHMSAEFPNAKASIND